MEHRYPFVQEESVGDAAVARLPPAQASPMQAQPQTTRALRWRRGTVAHSQERFIRQIFVDHRGCARLHASGGEAIRSKIIGLLGAPKMYLTLISLS